jgi:hypothetical protein
MVRAAGTESGLTALAARRRSSTLVPASTAIDSLIEMG